MNKKITFGLLLLTAIALVGLPNTLANSGIMGDFNAKYGTAGTALDTCSTCHTSAPSLNNYSTDLKSNSLNFAAIESLDSDKDGYTNIDEINARTFPGDPNSHPAAAPPAPTDTPPVIAITSPTEGQTFTTDAITVSGTASDDVGVSKVEVKVGAEGSYAEATGNTSWSAPVTLVSGSNTIYARATDTSGNTTETLINVTYNPQTPPPDTPPSTTAKVTFTVTDNETGLPIAGAKVSMNGSNIKTDNTGTAIFTNIIPGDYKYKVSAKEYEKSKDNISVTGDMTVTVKLVPETEDDEDNEDRTHEDIVHWLESMFRSNPCVYSPAGTQNSGHAGEDK